MSGRRKRKESDKNNGKQKEKSKGAHHNRVDNEEINQVQEERNEGRNLEDFQPQGALNVMAVFSEDEEQVTMEVDDQEFAEEGELLRDRSLVVSDEEIDINNNATRRNKIPNRCRPLSVCDSEADAVAEGRSRMEKLDSSSDDDEQFGPMNEKERKLFKKWEKYMKNKGFLTQDQGPRRSATTSRREEETRHKGDLLTELKSEMTMYENTVKRVADKGVGNNLRNSSSSEYNTGDDNIDFISTESSKEVEMLSQTRKEGFRQSTALFT